MIKIIVVPIYLDVEEFVKSRQMSSHEAREAYDRAPFIFEGEQKEALTALDVALNNGYSIFDKETMKTRGATKIFYVLHKKPLEAPPPQQD